jgi:hypothetical protein
MHRRMKDMKARLVPLGQLIDSDSSTSMTKTSAKEEMTASTALPTSDSTISAWTSSSDSVFEEFNEEIGQKYLVNTDNSGCTVMWHGLATKCQVEPHLIETLDRIGAENVGYIYLPQNHWETKITLRTKCRNKGYAFIHFREEAAAAVFAEKIAGHFRHSPQKRRTLTTMAEHQGVSANLRAEFQAAKTISEAITLSQKNGSYFIRRNAILGIIQRTYT